MATSTRAEIRAWMLDKWGLGRRGATTAASVTSYVTDDTRFGGPGAAEGIVRGCQLMMTSGNKAGCITNLAGQPILSSGQINLDPDLATASGAIASGDTFEILREPLRFGGTSTIGATSTTFGGTYSLHDAINQANQEVTWEMRLVPITLLTDGDMLRTGTTQDPWAENSCAGAKLAAAYPYGTRALSLTNSQPTGYVHQTINVSTSGPVASSRTYYLEATVRCFNAASSAVLACFDVTNSAALTLQESTSSSLEAVTLRNVISVPSTCKEIDIRLASGDVAQVTYWSNIILRDIQATAFVLADRPQRVLRLGRLLWRQSNATWADQAAFVPVRHHLEQLDVGLWRYVAEERIPAGGLWYEEFVQPEALTADSSTCAIPKEHVAAVAAEILLKPLKSRPYWKDIYPDLLKEAVRVRLEYADGLRTYVDQSQYTYPLLRV